MSARTGAGAISGATGAPQPTLLFIPDISGFTRFVNDTAISHSRHIIAELLEAIIDADELGLTVSEIEGDAILFYRPGAAPQTAETLAQVEKMYVAFHSHLQTYEDQRICQCGACCSAVDLELKFIAHHGIVAQERVKDYSKLFGRDVILVHRLLKNDVPYTEYALLTDDLLAASDGDDLASHAWSTVQTGSEALDVGTVGYRYLALEALSERVPEPTIVDYGLPDGVLVMERTENVKAPLSTVFNVLTDLSFRHEWLEGLVGSDELNHGIVQGGSTHLCVIKADGSDPFWVSHDFETGTNQVRFTETERKLGASNLYVIRSEGPTATRIELYTFLQGGRLKRLFFNLFLKPRLTKKNDLSYVRLREYAEELTREGRGHPAQIVLDLPGSNAHAVDAGGRSPVGPV